MFAGDDERWNPKLGGAELVLLDEVVVVVVVVVVEVVVVVVDVVVEVVVLVLEELEVLLDGVVVVVVLVEVVVVIGGRVVMTLVLLELAVVREVGWVRRKYPATAATRTMTTTPAIIALLIAVRDRSSLSRIRRNRVGGQGAK